MEEFLELIFAYHDLGYKEKYIYSKNEEIQKLYREVVSGKVKNDQDIADLLN
jgi:hypothetical protein